MNTYPETLRLLAAAVRRIFKVTYKKDAIQPPDHGLTDPPILQGAGAQLPTEFYLGCITDEERIRYGEYKTWLQWRHANGDDPLEHLLHAALRLGGEQWLRAAIDYHILGGFTDEDLQKLRSKIQTEQDIRARHPS